MAKRSSQEGILSRQKVNIHTVVVLVLLGFGSVTAGYSAAVMGITSGQPSFNEYFHLDSRSNGADLLATMNGLFSAGGVIGTLLLPTIADKWGRKWACAVSAILTIVSGALLAGSVNVGMFIAFRFIAGAGSFMSLAAVPLLMSEIAPVQMRGALIDIHASMFSGGYAIQAWIGFGFYWWTSESSNAWRPPIAIQCFWPLILLVGLFFVPESPRWLMMQDRASEAKEILLKLHLDPTDPNNDAAHAEFYQIQKQIAIDKTLGNTWWHILKKPSYRKRALIGCGITVMTPFSGIYVINVYGPTLYRLLQYSTTKALLFPSLWSTFNFVCNVIAITLVDRFPRPKYIAFGMFGCMASLIVETALIANFVPSNNGAALQAAVAMFFIFSAFFNLCIDGTQFSYLGEVFPTHLRAKGVCLGIAHISFQNILWLQVAPVALRNIGWRFFLCFIIPGTIACIVMWIWFPDTKGRPLEEIAALFGDVDEVAIYQHEIEIDAATHTIRDLHQETKSAAQTHFECISHHETTGSEKY
ncbi:uncharacterized protein A1O5_01720 [Cladophialophora psammophila CBS 110553]|uniref:Major facilitator superfamily (MFS) profile domain-containing protein n=1 Tax=Cladophialophora psammophila CBS 110553 TaxID=1182543 RepID=W9XXN2_9EURO|nr:uncharacterized protein A1O5_01720 [Cladophialophora psammophila CBS 110553]EXJ75024.1 hypothetical protein A1O5_01720 [Cladophialophora psammophila CBS 110553]